MKKLMIIIAALSMVATFVLSATAAEWNFYGNARVATFVTDVETPGARDDKDFTNDLQTNSRIGANIKVSDELSARFEFGTGQSVGAEAVRTRLIYGVWNFGGGNLTVGQFWTPVNWFFSSQTYAGDNGLLQYGTINNLRQPGIQVAFGGFKLALLKPSESDLTTGDDTDTSIPKIEAAYIMNFDGGHFAKLVAGYNSYEVDALTYDSDIDSYVVGLSAKYNFGPMSIAGGVWSAENNTTYRSGLFTASGIAPSIGANGAVTDVEEFGYAVVLGYKMNDMVSFEAGYGYSEAERDDALATTSEDDASSWYIQSTITFAPGVFIVPEIGILDQQDDEFGADEGDTFYYGLKWQINF